MQSLKFNLQNACHSRRYDWNAFNCDAMCEKAYNFMFIRNKRNECAEMETTVARLFFLIPNFLEFFSLAWVFFFVFSLISCRSSDFFFVNKINYLILVCCCYCFCCGTNFPFVARTTHILREFIAKSVAFDCHFLRNSIYGQFNLAHANMSVRMLRTTTFCYRIFVLRFLNSEHWF